MWSEIKVMHKESKERYMLCDNTRCWEMDRDHALPCWAASWSLTLHLQNSRKTHFCHISHPLCHLNIPKDKPDAWTPIRNNRRGNDKAAFSECSLGDLLNLWEPIPSLTPSPRVQLSPIYVYLKVESWSHPLVWKCPVVSPWPRGQAPSIMGETL